MCGRAYATYTDEELALRYLDAAARRQPLGIGPNYNLSPTQQKDVIDVDDTGQRRSRRLRWGLVPHWAKDVKVGYKMINARAETVHERPAFRQAFLRRRCIVPLSGFYEWRRSAAGKQPFAIQRQDGDLLSVAAIWESWQPAGQAQPLHSFALLTCGANRMMQAIHDRMPVILPRQQEALWLDREVDDVAALGALLRPCPDSWLRAYPVRLLVNSPRNNSPELLRPLEMA